MKLKIAVRTTRAREAMNRAFLGCEFASVVLADIVSLTDVSAVISPANSFGWMDGGVDQVYVYEFGKQLEDRVQRRIVDDYQGELQVGDAFVMSTGSNRIPYIIIAPTMRIPGPVRDTQNAYLAMRAAVLAARRFNTQAGAELIATIGCPGLGTGTGAIPIDVAAAQMRRGWDDAHGCPL